MESGEIDMEQSYEAGKLILQYKKYRHPDFLDQELTFEIIIDVEKLGVYMGNPPFLHPHTRPIPTADVAASVTVGKKDDNSTGEQSSTSTETRKREPLKDYKHPKYPNEKLTYEVDIDENRLEREIKDMLDEHKKMCQTQQSEEDKDPIGIKHPHTRTIPTSFVVTLF